MRFSLLMISILYVSTGSAQQVDSLLSRASSRIGLDSLHVAQKPLDSIQSSFYKGANSIKAEVSAKLASLDATKNKLQAKIDSLSSLKLPANKYTAKLDSVN